MDLTKLLPGRKTYIAAAGLGLLALYHWQQKDPATAGQLLLQALGLFGLRSALTNQPPTPPAPPTPTA